jgi:hypothetical protein
MTAAQRTALLLLALFSACSGATHTAPVAAPAAKAADAPSAPIDSAAIRRRADVQLVMRQIVGNERKPAGEVFKNIRTEAFKTFPAGRIPALMDQGYGRSLGVSCAFCHIQGRWDSDSLQTKRIARQMQAMVFAINADLLSKTGVPQGAVVNCTTCHRGATKPISNLP